MLRLQNAHQTLVLDILPHSQRKKTTDPLDDWLRVSVEVQDDSRGKPLRRSSECLLVLELKELCHWVDTLKGNPEECTEMDFIEPDLKFRYSPRTLTVQLSYDLVPENIDCYELDFVMDSKTLERLSQELHNLVEE